MVESTGGASIPTPDPTLDQRIAQRVRSLRAAQGLTLEQLATRSGVSRSMISVVERGESSPTAALLDKLAAGLGVTLNLLLEAPTPAESAPAPLVRRERQVQWRDPESGYERRVLSPPGYPSMLQLVEVHFPPGAQVQLDAGVQRAQVHQQIWLLEGRMQITVGEQLHDLAEGDCLAFPLNHPVRFRNPSRRRARYLVALASPSWA